MRARAILVALAVALALAILAPAAEAAFGIASSGSLNDDAGQPLRQAGAHPDLNTSIQFPSTVHPGENPGEETVTVEENVKDVKIHLPAGLVANPTTVPTCSQTGLRGNGYVADCPIGSQIGTVDLYFTLSGTTPQQIPLFNLAPPPGVPAQFGFNYFQARVFIDSHVVADPAAPGGYTIESDSLRTTQALALTEVDVHLWGVPASPSHDLERVEQGGELQGIPPGGVKSTEPSERPLFDNPGLCSTTPGRFTAEANSWADPTFFGAAFEADPGGDPFTFTGCGSQPFEPSVEVQPTTREADSPSGLQVTVKVPQNENPTGLASADLKEAVLTLPEGMTINPASAGGLAACSNAQIGLGGDEPAACPEASKIGSVEIQTPLLDHPIGGGVYLARQGENKFGSLLAIYLAVDDPLSGTVLKLPGRIATGPTGRLTTSFAETPQLPFDELKVDLFGGGRAPLRTPGACGTYSSQASFTPWSGTAPVVAGDSFRIESGPGGGACPSGGFDPKLAVATANPLAGRYSPLSFELFRVDATQTLAGLELALPEGVLGKLAGIPPCSDQALATIPGGAGTGAGELASPSCPAASRIGTVAVTAGAGPLPIAVDTGSVYLGGPYKGAPLSIAVVAPALAGPFDLGNVVVRSALRVDPTSTQVTAVSDPFPQILQGIPLDLREVAVAIDREGFVRNPTSCAPMAVAARIAGGGGATAAVTQPFRVAGCAGLAFAPKLGLKLSGATRRAGYPALAATVRATPGEADIGRVSVALPHSEFLAQNHIGTVCTRVQFAAGQTPGEKCPRASIYGRATAVTPLLDQPLSGPVYLRSSSRTLPDLVVALNGQIDVDLDGRIDTYHGGIRTSFDAVPDAPISKFTLKLKGGAKSLLQNSADLCRSTVRATVRMTGHNGKTHDTETPVGTSCASGRPHQK